MSASEDYYKRLRSKYEEYKQYILNYGKTPSYSIEGNGDKLIITVNHYSSYSFVGRGFLSDDKIDYSLEYENGRYEIRRILLLGKGDRHRSEQLSKAVREAVFYDFCEGDNYIMRVYDNNDSYYYRFREAVNYLSKYYKSEWWVWPFGNPIYKMD